MVRPGTRTKEEDEARAAVRSLVRSVDSKIYKKHDEKGSPYVQALACSIWPQGLMTYYHGWRETLERFTLCKNRPELVIDGMYVPSYEDDEPEELE